MSHPSQPIVWNATTRAYVVLGVALLAGSTAAPIIRLAQGEGLPSLAIAVLRMCFSALILTPIILRRYRDQIAALTWQDIAASLGAGFFFVTHITFFVTSLEYTSVMMNVVITNTSPLWVALIEVIVLRARLHRLVWLGLFVTLTGGLIIALGSAGASATGSNPPLGALLALIGSLTASIYLVIGRVVRGKVSFIPYIWLLFTGGALAGLIYTTASGTPLIGYDPAGYVWVLLLIALAQFMGHGGFNFVVKYIPATLVSLGLVAIVIPSSILAFLLFREVPQGLDVLGSAVIAAGVALAVLGQSRKRKAQEGDS